ncbi:MAG TPA: IPT/TIG domain-containing protein [Thermoanaerobaculia bacterium]|jgi:hypothetical protein|nr:IPT/TIG domain-containing protein [Thermoanaerobaculia bacterium]
MRLIPGIFLALLATTALAQNDDFGFYPNFGPPEGGTEINIHASANTYLRFTAPQVFFGDVASPRVTLVDAYNVKAVAPPQPIGAVAVTVRDNGALLHSLSQFVFEPQLEEIIIPIALQPTDASFGTRWVSEISVYNDSDDVVPIDSELCSVALVGIVPCSKPPRRVQPHSSMSVEPLSAYASQPMMWLLPPADHADRLHFTVRLHETSRDPDGPGTEIPVIRSRDFQKTQVWLPSIPTSSRFRSTLRVLTEGYSVTVRMMDDTTGQLLSEQTVQRSFPTDGPSLGMVTFDNPLAAAVVGAHERVRIEAESQSPVWAMVTLTDNESQRVQIFTPR